ncbi:MAG: TetR/AcrR family transcriptional regulator [Actinomycetales bacterium]|nr:TetR/AcrR family transcriptional regulator [Actinomycetales bacterium]
MPRVSQQHRDARRRQIVAAAARSFAGKGFHRTSMQDVVAESGLSAGAVYRYFRSKDELVRTVAEEGVATLEEALDLVLAGEGGQLPHQEITQVLRHVLAIATRGDVDLTRIAVSAWAEALGDDDLRALVHQAYAGPRHRLATLASRWRDAGHLRADADPDAVAQVLLSAVTGFVLLRLVLGEGDPERYAQGLRDLLPPD